MLKSLIKRLPPIAALIAERDALVRAHGLAPPGHFYSPVISIPEIQRDEQRVFRDPPGNIPGIDLNESEQLELIEKFALLYPSIDFPSNQESSHRYYYENPAYLYSDAIMLHCMMRHFRPRKIIEVGSGHSSCAILDTRERFLGEFVAVTFIEPYTALLKSLIRPEDTSSITIIPTRLQDVPLDKFRELEQDDILFIDSTHVSKTGSDVNYLFFEILPALNPGVHVHIHDIFYPFEYPKEWVMGGRSWNEIYVLKAFLQYNSQFRITLMNTYLELFHEAWFQQNMPMCLRNRGGSIWLRRIGQPLAAGDSGRVAYFE